MESIDILTGQHITIKYEPASIAKRMLAIVLDYIFMMAYILAICYLYFGLLDIKLFAGDTMPTVIFFLLYIPIVFYHITFETLMNGQTPGKLITKIRVTNVDGSTSNFVSYFLRWVLLPIDMLPYGGVGALFILFTKNHQRLGDLAAGTTVVKLVPSSAKYNLDNVFNEFAADYRPTFQQVDALTEGQIRLISELLENHSKEQVVTHSIDELAFKIKQKLHIESQLDSRIFLETIVKDYNYFAIMEI